MHFKALNKQRLSKHPNKMLHKVHIYPRTGTDRLFKSGDSHVPDFFSITYKGLRANTSVPLYQRETSISKFYFNEERWPELLRHKDASWYYCIDSEDRSYYVLYGSYPRQDVFKVWDLHRDHYSPYTTSPIAKDL